MSQWVFNLLIVAGSIILLVVIISLVLGFNPFAFLFNTLVYILVVVGVIFAVPAFIAFAVPYWGIYALDEMADSGEYLGGGHVIPGAVTSAILGLVWMKWVIPGLIVLPQLNEWMWRFLRFPKEYTGMPWGWFVVIFLLSAVAYFAGASARE